MATLLPANQWMDYSPGAIGRYLNQSPASVGKSPYDAWQTGYGGLNLPGAKSGSTASWLAGIKGDAGAAGGAAGAAGATAGASYTTMPSQATLANSMQPGQTFTVGNTTYTWTGTNAVPAGGSSSSLYGVFGGGSVGALANEFQGKIDEANAANEARYQQAVTGYGQLETDVTGLYAGQGAQTKADIGRSAEAQYADIGQDAVSRGLSGTTMPRSEKYGVFREAEGAKASVDEAVARNTAAAIMSARTGKLGVIERREDIAPDYGTLMGLAGKLGEGQGSSGGSSATVPPVEGVDSASGTSTGMWGYGTASTGFTNTAGTSASAQGKNFLAQQIMQFYPGVSKWADLSADQKAWVRGWTRENYPQYAQYLPS